MRALRPLPLLAAFCILSSDPLEAQTSNDAAINQIRIVELQGTVEVSPAGAKTWVLTQTNQLLYPFDRLRTGTNSRVALLWSDQSVVPFGPSTELEILPPHTADAQSGLHLVRGVISFFHRDQPGRIRIITRGAVAGVEGTEFVVAVNDADRTTLSVIDGKVTFGNDTATVVLTNGQQAVADPGTAPVRTAGFVANNLLQWSFYYPAVLDLKDLELTPAEQSALADSISAYRAGDLLSALAKYPTGRQPSSDIERVYYAALLLSVGQAEPAQAALAPLSGQAGSERVQKLAAALRRLISAVKHETATAAVTPQLATEFLASSYYEQSRAGSGNPLQTALHLAREAARISPESGFAWTRVAELEFSFGRLGAAREALEKGLALSPRNAEALAVKGFLLAGQNDSREAIDWFNRALSVDSALGNAWLGRGLCRIRQNDREGGKEDLLVAAALEPQRSELRSYLGKAWGEVGDFGHATKELKLAETLDPQDPTPWLYSALVNQEHNRVNDAVRDLEKSQDLNDNRSVYRSSLLLEQDRAVRSANLARIYQDAGMSEVAFREAGRAVNSDYGNYSAHLFLAEGLNPGLDLISRRYESAARTEYFLANLLSPANAGLLSPTLSQSEYSRLFERNRLGVYSSTEYLSRGAWAENGSQFGIFEKSSYSLEWGYASDPGQHLNGDSEVTTLDLRLKQQIAPQDTVYFQIGRLEAKYGDVGPRYDPTIHTVARNHETQEPSIYAGYHHEWSPGIHTLLFLGMLKDRYSFTNLNQGAILTDRIGLEPMREWAAVVGFGTDERLENQLEMYSAELQQIFQVETHTTTVGGRFQYGSFDVENLQSNPGAPATPWFPDPPTPTAQQDLASFMRRESIYAYHQWNVLDSLELIGGLTYDRVTFPENVNFAPLSEKEKTRDQLSPKAGLIWTPARNTTARFAYTRSLFGAGVDQSFQIEPSQVAGFVQSYRSIIPEALGGVNAAARFETWGFSLEQKLDTGTYLGLSGELLNSQVHRTVGAFDGLPDEFDFAIPSGLRNHLDYEERSLLFTANQLMSRDWALGMRYRVSQATLKSDFVDVPDGILFDGFQPRQRLEAVLHNVDLVAAYNHPCGFFSRAEATWYAQSDIDALAQTGDDFWQLNAFAGYRLPRRKAELLLGILNISDQDYRLNPLNVYADLPRERTVTLRFRLSF